MQLCSRNKLQSSNEKGRRPTPDCPNSIAVSEKPNVVGRLFDILGFLVQMNTLSQARERERETGRENEGG